MAQFTFKQFLLLESDQRVQYLKNAFKDKISEDILDQIVKADPHRNNIYTQWLINQYLKKGFNVQDLGEIRKFLVNYDSVKPYLSAKFKDIMASFKLQPGVSFNQQQIISEFNDEFSKIQETRGLDLNGNFIGGDIIKKYTPTKFLVHVKNSNYCVNKAIDSGWCLKASDYAQKFTQNSIGVFLMENDVAVLACDYEPAEKKIVDIQGRFNKPWEPVYDKQVIDILKYVGIITDITFADNRNSFWSIYKERSDFKQAVDNLPNIQLPIETKKFLIKKGIPYKLTPDETSNLAATEKLDLGLQLTPEEIASLPISVKYIKGFELTDSDKEKLKDTLLGKTLDIIKDKLSDDSVAELFPEDTRPENKMVFDSENFAVEIKNSDAFYRDVYELSDTDIFYLTMDYDGYGYDSSEANSDEITEYVEDRPEGMLDDSHIKILKEIFNKIGRPGIADEESAEKNENPDSTFNDGVLSKFFNEFKNEISYSLRDFYTEVYYEADKLKEKRRKELVDMLPFGLYHEKERSYYSYEVKGVSGLVSTWQNLSDFLGKYKPDVKSFKELFDSYPVIDAENEIFGKIDFDETFSTYHYTNEVDFTEINKKLLDSLTDFMDELEYNDDLADTIAGTEEIDNVMDQLGFVDNVSTKNGITIQILDKDVTDPENIKVKIKRTINDKTEEGFVKIENLYKYFQKSMFERKFFKSFDEFINESKKPKK